MKRTILEYIDNLYTLWVLIKLWWMEKRKESYLY
jgi:hypothetical protein